MNTELSKNWDCELGSACRCATKPYMDHRGCLNYIDGPKPPIKDDDPVNHPSHYNQHPSGIECIQITEHMSFNLGNAMKYLWRAEMKNKVQDLDKAIWYIKREKERWTNEK